MWDILRETRLNDSEKYELVKKFDKIFGLNLDKTKTINIPKKVKELSEERKKARKNKEWKKSDNLREKIKKLGYVIEDTDKGYRLKKK